MMSTYEPRIISINIAPQGSIHPETFLWASGIENTFVPQVRPGERALDEYELMGHYQHWREDLALARDLGLNALRWGVPWYRVEPKQGQFDWARTDQVISYLVEELGITPIIDLMHYGCPFWLQGSLPISTILRRSHPARQHSPDATTHCCACIPRSMSQSSMR